MLHQVSSDDRHQAVRVGDARADARAPAATIDFDPALLQPASPPRLAIVLGMSETGLGTLRLLARRGARCWGVDAPLDLPGFRSRYCERRIHVPTELSPAELSAILRHAILGEGRRPVVVPTADRFVKLLSDARDGLRDRFDMALPAPPIVDDLLDKRRFADLAARAGLRVPRTTHLSDLAALEEAARRTGYPAVVKPRKPGDEERASFPKAIVLWTAGEARALAATAASRGRVPALVVQEYIPGGDACHVSVAMAFDSRSAPIASFVSRKRRQGNHGAGVGTFVESHRDEEAAATARTFLQRIGYVGVAEMEMKRHAVTGELFAIEVNPRLWSQVALPAALGVDFALLYCQMAAGAVGGAEIQPLPRPCAWQDLWSDLYWTFGRGGYWRKGEISLGDWLRQSLATRAHPYFAWHDPAPAIRRAMDALRRLTRGERA